MSSFLEEFPKILITLPDEWIFSKAFIGFIGKAIFKLLGGNAIFLSNLVFLDLQSKVVVGILRKVASPPITFQPGHGKDNGQGNTGLLAQFNG